MFGRIDYDSWTSLVPHVSFWLTFLVFLGITARAFLLKGKTVRRLEQLPLRDDETGTLPADKK